MKTLALLLLSASAWGQSVLFNGNSPVAASDPIGAITGAGKGLTISTGTTFTSSVTVNGILAATTVTVPAGTGSKCFSADDPTLVVNCNTHTVSFSGSTMTVLSTGLVGIGTSNPLAGLEVNRSVSGNSAFFTNPQFGKTIQIYNDSTYAIIGSSTNNSFTLGANNGAVLATLNTNGALSVGTYGTTQPAAPANGLIVSGNVGVGTATPATLLDVNGAATIRGQETVVSSISIKMDTVPLNLDTVTAGDVASYIYWRKSDTTGRAAVGYEAANSDFYIDNAKAGALLLNTNNVNAMTIASGGGVTFAATSPVTVSSAAFVGTYVSTQTAGAAGASVTALCKTATVAAGTTFAQGGGCSCSGGVALTATIGIPNCQTTGCIPSGWTCQAVGGTGGACSSYAVCSRLQ